MAISEREIDGRKYRVESLNAMEQFHVVRRLAPVLHSALFFVGATMESVEAFKAGDKEKSNSAFVEASFASKPLLIDLSRMEDSELEYVIHTVLKHVKVQQGSSWAPLSVNNQLMFDDMGLVELFKVVETVLKEQLRPIWSASKLSAFLEAARMQMKS